MSGLYSDVPGGYNQLLSHLPTHGIIAISIQSILEVPSDSLYLLYANIIQFLGANLTQYLPAGVGGDINGSLVGMGHSAGGKIIVKTLLEECTLLRAAILHSPVDGLDPWGWINDYVLDPPNLVNFSVPVLLMGTGLESLPGREFLPPCGPPDRNFNKFFSCMRPDMYFLEALDFGHADFLDDELWETLYLSQFCKTTTDVNGRQYYIDFAAGAITAFIVGIVQGNCATLEYLTNAATFPIPNVNVNTTKLINSCPTPKCTRD
uniref:Chlorophyllase n=1 Tax=Arcella intermedia TaxID=1963864 RepID=A0A6B2LCZ1_9EUKA